MTPERGAVAVVLSLTPLVALLIIPQSAWDAFTWPQAVAFFGAALACAAGSYAAWRS